MSASSLSHKATQYLQTIHQLAQNGQEVRQITVARQLKVSPSTCFEGVLRLMKKKYVTEDEHKHLHLTPEGKNVLATIERNQYIFTNFFKDVLGNTPPESKHIAAQIEPILDFQTAGEMCKFSRFLETLKGQKVDFWQAWENFENNIETDPVCKACPHKSFCRKNLAS